MYTWVTKLYGNAFRGLSREAWILSIVMLINRSGLMVLPFLTLYCTQELGFSLIRAGIVTGAYGVGSLAGSLIGGWLSDRFGFYKIIAWSLFAGAAGMASLVFFREFYALTAAVFFASTIADIVRPPLMSAISHFSAPEKQTRAISLLRMAVNLGISIGPALGGFLAVTAGFFWLFIIEGATCALAGIAFLVLLPAGKYRAVHEKTAAGMPAAIQDTIYLAFLGICALNIIAFIQILSTVPVYFREVLLLSEARIGLFFTFNGLLVFFFEMPLVFLSERIFRPFVSLSVGAGMMIFAQICLNLDTHWLIVIGLYNVLISFGEIINFPFGNSLALHRAPTGQKGRYMGLWATMFSLSFIIAPVLGTNLIESVGFEASWYFFGAMHLLSIFGYMLVEKHWKKSSPEARKSPPFTA